MLSASGSHASWLFGAATLLCLIFHVSAFAQVSSPIPIPVPMTAERWRPLGADSMGPKAELQFLRKEGFPQGVLVVKAGTAALNGLVFRDGTIDFDVKPLSQDMPGIQFRDRKARTSTTRSRSAGIRMEGCRTRMVPSTYLFDKARTRLPSPCMPPSMTTFDREPGTDGG